MRRKIDVIAKRDIPEIKAWINREDKENECPFGGCHVITGETYRPVQFNKCKTYFPDIDIKKNECPCDVYAVEYVLKTAKRIVRMKENKNA